MGKGTKWAIGIAAVLVVGGIINAVDGGGTDDTAAAGTLLTGTSSSTPATDPTTPTISSRSIAVSSAATSSTITSAAAAEPAAATTLAPPPAPAAVSAATQANPIVALLATIPVKGRAPKTGYERYEFGIDWSDDVTVAGGHNGCDTRNDILRRDLTAITIKPDSNGCTVLTGTLADPYTGKSIDFVRGRGTSTAVQIDHVVALSDAWQKGAQQLTVDQRKNLANDPINLQAVDGPTNAQKGDGDAATWLPPSKAYRCTYVSRQVQVKARYSLWVTQAEHDAILRVLASCGATTPVTSKVAPKTTTVASVTSKPPAPKTTSVAPKTSAPPRTTVKPPAPKTTVPPPPPTTSVWTPAPPADVYYSNCSAARAAGAAPLYVGDPGYRSGLDRDHDGVACE